MATQSKMKILAVVGPTASGKSALALALAERLNGEIVSCDSMQIYRKMDIGTAKPTLEEQRRVRHHLVDCVDPDRAYSCAEYVEDAAAAVRDITARGKLPIFCGGTGLYLDCVLRGGHFEETESDPAKREALFAYAAEHGNAALHARLTAVDPESAAAIHPNNLKRVVRALEIFESTGMTKSEADKRSRMVESPYEATVIGLRYDARELLYDRIDRRVDQMIDEGLLEETKQLLEDGVFEKNATAAQAIGYKELLGYLRGEMPLTDAVEDLKRATRRYAKRQITWFGAKDYVCWVDASVGGVMRGFDDVLQDALDLLGDPI